MQLTYRKLFEVEIKHDYYMLPGPGEKYPSDYNISTITAITPSSDTAQVMRDHKMVLKVTARGFAVYIHAEFISTLAAHVSSIDLDPKIGLSFFWSLQNPYFANFTNQRLQEKSTQIYYFSNRSASQQGAVLYLNKPIVPFGTTYLGETRYHLGDILKRGGKTYEMIEKESPITNFPANASKFQTINTSIINYINPSDRIRWCPMIFHHDRTNTQPGEFITYKLLDADANPVELGLIMGTDRPQNEYISPASGADNVNHFIDLHHVPPGRYTMEISGSGGTTTESFYLADPLHVPGLFCVSEFFVGGAGVAFRFATEDPASKRWTLDATPKKFNVRFRNRMTRWKYLNQDQTVFHTPTDAKPLARVYSGYEIPVPGGTLKLPDPSVDRIIPEIETELVKNIYSEIFLSK